MRMDLMFRVLNKGLEFADYAKKRGDSASDPEVWLRRGIADLDFDPVYFLATEQTSPEGWAVKK